MKAITNRISIIIPAYNEEKNIGKCLKAAIEYLPKNKSEIIVVDNASTDKTAAIARKFPRVKVIYEPKKGPNKARQKGLSVAKGPLLAFVDADSMVTKNWFRTMEKRFSKDERLVCLSGPCKYYDLPIHKRFIINVGYLVFYKPVFILTKAIVVGGNFVVRKEAMEKIGGFDTSINLFGDDSDVGRRIKKVGKTAFSLRFYNFTSGRRFKKEGIIKTFLVYYASNFVWIMLFHRPLTKNSRDVRE